MDTLSTMRGKQFAADYGVLINDGPLAGLTARAVLVLDENNKVIHAELVSEIADELNFTDGSHLNKIFKRAYGKTAYQFKESID